MSDFLLGTLITAVAGIVVAAITSSVALYETRKNGREIKTVRSDSAASRAQVENSHTTNLRAEQDERHAEIIKRFDDTAERLDRQDKQIYGVQKDIRGVRADIGRLQNHNEKVDDRIRELEAN